MSKLNINLFRYLPAEIIAIILYATNSPLHFYVLYNCLKSCEFITKNNKLRYVDDDLIKSIELNCSLKSLAWYIKFLFIVNIVEKSYLLNNWYFVFSIAAKNNYKKDVLKMLLIKSKVDPSVNNNVVIRRASKNGHFNVVELLLADPLLDPSVNYNYAIIESSKNGHFNVVKLLLADPRVDPSADGNEAIKCASYNGHKEIVKLLLKDKRVDPSVDNNYAIRWVTYYGHTEIVKLLLMDPRVNLTKFDKLFYKYGIYLFAVFSCYYFIYLIFLKQY